MADLHRNRLALAVLGLAVVGMHLVPAQVPGEPPAWVGRDFFWTLALMLPASGAWLYLTWAAVRGRFRPGFAGAFAFAAALRLLALPLQPQRQCLHPPHRQIRFERS